MPALDPLSHACTLPCPGPLQVRRLDPLIDWDKDSRVEIGRLRAELLASNNQLQLARYGRHDPMQAIRYSRHATA